MEVKTQYTGRPGMVHCSRCNQQKPKLGSRYIGKPPKIVCFPCHNNPWRIKKGLPPLLGDEYLSHRDKVLEIRKHATELEELKAAEQTGKRKCCSCRKWNPEEEYKVGGPFEMFSVNCRACQNKTERNKHSLALFKSDVEALRKLAAHCMICDKELTETGHIDHCHETRNIRGILCFTCNTAIGKLKDSAALLRRAAEYIEKGTWILP